MECRNVANVCDVKSLRYLCMVSLPSGACELWRTLADFGDI